MKESSPNIASRVSTTCRLRPLEMNGRVQGTAIVTIPTHG